MKKLMCILVILFFPLHIYPQVVLRAGMGIHFQNTPSLNDYINKNYASSADQLGDFNSVIVFSGEGGYLVSDNYEIAIELGYLIGSYTYTTFGKYEFSYDIIMPSLVSYYVISDQGYQIKFGAGAGVRFVNIEETKPGYPAAIEYNSTGVGFLLRADGNTLLGGSLYANIGVDLRYDINGEPEKNGSFIQYGAAGEKVNLNALSIGLRLGVAFIF